MMKDFSYHIFDDGQGYCDVDMRGSLGILHFTHYVETAEIRKESYA